MVGLVTTPEHPLGLGVERRQLGAPVGDVRPLRVGEERGRRLVEGVGVVERAAADPGAGQDHHVLEQVDPLQAVAARACGAQRKLRRSQEVFGSVVLVEALAGLQHADPVALLGQPQRGDAAAEAGADHQHVVVVARTRRPPCIARSVRAYKRLPVCKSTMPQPPGFVHAMRRQRRRCHTGGDGHLLRTRTSPKQSWPPTSRRSGTRSPTRSCWSS